MFLSRYLDKIIFFGFGHVWYSEPALDENVPSLDRRHLCFPVRFSCVFCLNCFFQGTSDSCSLSEHPGTWVPCLAMLRTCSHFAGFSVRKTVQRFSSRDVSYTSLDNYMTRAGAPRCPHHSWPWGEGGSSFFYPGIMVQIPWMKTVFWIFSANVPWTFWIIVHVPTYVPTHRPVPVSPLFLRAEKERIFGPVFVPVRFLFQVLFHTPPLASATLFIVWIACLKCTSHCFY